MYKHILIPTDGSELAHKAVMHGLALAKSVGARVTVVTATRMWSPMAMAGQVRLHEQHPVEDYEAKSAQWARHVLEGPEAEAKQAGVACAAVHANDMDADAAIVETAKMRGCDLIVMSSHGRGSIGRLLLGSVALKVLTTTTIPVQIVR